MNRIFILLVMFSLNSEVTVAQVGNEKDFEYEVNLVSPPLSIVRADLESAVTITDLNRYYKNDWVRKYQEVILTTIQDGVHKTSVGTTHKLTDIQKENLLSADFGEPITIVVKYIPDNQLKFEETKEFNFTFIVEPSTIASYPGGQDLLTTYIEDHAVGNIPNGLFDEFALSAVSFTINETGKIIDVHMFESTGDETIDNSLIEAICDMPNWQPATYADGKKVKQTFALMIGNMKSCVTNLLNIRKYKLDVEN